MRISVVGPTRTSALSALPPLLGAKLHLVARLHAGGFTLLDTQFVTDHLKTFGAIEVPRRQYHKLLESALVGEGDFMALDKRGAGGAQVMAQLSTN